MALCFTMILPAVAKFQNIPLRKVPISRLIKNLQAGRTETGASPLDKAMIDFRIGRLHAMAYALKTEEANTMASAPQGSRYELPDFGHMPDHLQFSIVPTKNPGSQSLAKKHLKEAIKFMRQALAADPRLLAAELGLAWCLDQSGEKQEKAEALKLYRRVFNEAYSSEESSRGGMYNWSISVETAQYLRKLLDKNKDAKELSEIDKKVALIDKLPHYITPLIIPLKGKTALTDLLENKQVSFNLSGLGARVYKSWPTSCAGWLVFDWDGSKKVHSGLQLFGSVTFWLFWRNGYEALSSLDDNRDGRISGAELKRLAIWQDLNANGLSDPAEVRSLSDHAIVSLSCRARPFGKRDWISDQGVVFADGRHAPTYDVSLSD